MQKGGFQMTDPFYQELLAVKKQWDASSFTLQNQINDLKGIQRQTKGTWNTIISDHIEFLAHFNNEAYDFIHASMHYHKLQRMSIITLNETVTAYAKQSPDVFIEMIKQLKNA